jgi:uncharacterized RDD family membrane protein YckC
MNTEYDLCPLCEQTKHMNKAKPLYGYMVCKKCYYSFANRRQLAFILDAVGLRIVTLLFGIALGLAMASSRPSPSEIEVAGTALGILLTVVFCFKDCFAGQSPGKALTGVRVIDSTTGQPGGIGASFKRNLPVLIPFMPLIVAYQLCKGHRIGDGWSKTKVIWKKYAAHPIFLPAQASETTPSGS